MSKSQLIFKWSVNMKLTFLFLSFFFASVAYAEIYKCILPPDQTLFQSEPCPASTLSQQVVKIEDVPPHVLAEAQVEYKAWQKKQAALAIADARAAAEQQNAQQQQAIVNALTRSANAQQQQAIAAQEQALDTPYIYHPNIIGDGEYDSNAEYSPYVYPNQSEAY
jgi:hypothetical protein